MGNVDINDIYQKRPWVAGSVNGSDGAIVSTLGRYSFTVDRRASGTYHIAWTSNTMPSTLQIVQCTVRKAHGSIITSQPTQTGIRTSTSGFTGPNEDRSFSFRSISSF